MSIEKKTFFGKEYINHILSGIPNNSGVYKMIDLQNKILYIGKAKNLHNRIYSYGGNNLSPRIEYMVSQISTIEWIITATEQDALLLESDLIKSHQPKYNILLKDDKTFPFIKIDFNHDFPRIHKFRSKNATSQRGIFGPFASSFVVDDSIKVVQNLFKLRTCSDNIFANRQQPCILYQIKRCSAPCVNKLSKKDYKDLLDQSINFLNGNNNLLKQQLMEQLETLKNNRNYEQAIVIRDRIKNLNDIATKQGIILDKQETADFIAIVKKQNYYIAQVFLFKKGHNYGSTDLIFEEKLDEDAIDIWQNFILHFYQNRDLPPKIYINYIINNDNQDDFNTIVSLLRDIKFKKTTIVNPSGDQHKTIMNVVLSNANETIDKKLLYNTKWEQNFIGLQNVFHIPKKINKIEVYDNSHLYGTLSLGVMVCAKIDGFSKANYRVFNLKDKQINGNDDYGILKEVIYRRFIKIAQNKEEAPDLVLIDGGKGQLAVAYGVLVDLGLGDIPIIGVAKGVNRNAGEEKLFLPDNSQIILDKYSNDLHFIQMLRNEAHRFAIKSLRKRSLSNLAKSDLDKIPEIGAKRKKNLLHYFGSLDKIKNASIEDIMKVEGINNHIAIKIFNWFN